MHKINIRNCHFLCSMCSKMVHTGRSVKPENVICDDCRERKMKALTQKVKHDHYK